MFLYFFKYKWRQPEEATLHNTNTQQTSPHGDGAACPSSGVDLMNPHHPTDKQPCSCISEATNKGF